MRPLVMGERARRRPATATQMTNDATLQRRLDHVLSARMYVMSIPAGPRLGLSSWLQSQNRHSLSRSLHPQCRPYPLPGISCSSRVPTPSSSASRPTPLPQPSKLVSHPAACDGGRGGCLISSLFLPLPPSLPFVHLQCTGIPWQAKMFVQPATLRPHPLCHGKSSQVSIVFPLLHKLLAAAI